MPFKTILAAVALIALGVFANATYGTEELKAVEPTPRISPTRICPTTYIAIELDKELELGLAVWAKDGTFLYLADPNSFTTIPYYWQGQPQEVRADALYGVTYSTETGMPLLKPVFTEPRAYDFVFSDNMHTEPENSIYITRTVQYLGKDHPDCPKFPME